MENNVIYYVFDIILICFRKNYYSQYSSCNQGGYLVDFEVVNRNFLGFICLFFERKIYELNGSMMGLLFLNFALGL